jgi:hypothetical protein
VSNEGVLAGIGPQEGFKRTHSFLVGRYLSQAGVPPWVGSHSRLGNGINEQGLKEYKAEREVEATTDELD